jgi:hypothetical protein
MAPVNLKAVYQKGISGSHELRVTLRGHELWCDCKYTILEMGFALYFPVTGGFTKEWLNAYGENCTIQYPENIVLESSRTCLATSNPVLVALALQEWWSKNDENMRLREGNVPIPSFAESVEIVRNRKILNKFNLPFTGQVPGLYKHSEHDLD